MVDSLQKKETTVDEEKEWVDPSVFRLVGWRSKRQKFIKGIRINSPESVHID